MYTSSINVFLDINQSIAFGQGTKIRCATSARFFSCPTHSMGGVDGVHRVRQGTSLTNASAPSTASPQRQIQRPFRHRAKETPAAHPTQVGKGCKKTNWRSGNWHQFHHRSEQLNIEQQVVRSCFAFWHYNLYCSSHRHLSLSFPPPRQECGSGDKLSIKRQLNNVSRGWRRRLHEIVRKMCETLSKTVPGHPWCLRHSSLCQCITGLTLSRSYQPSSRMSPHMQGMQNKHLQNANAASRILEVEDFLMNMFLCTCKIYKEFSFKCHWTVPQLAPGRLSAFLCKRFLSLRSTTLTSNLSSSPSIHDDFSYPWASKLTRPNVWSVQIHRFDQRSKTWWSWEEKTNKAGTAPKMKVCKLAEQNTFWKKKYQEKASSSKIFCTFANEMDESTILIHLGMVPSASETFEVLTQCRTIHQHPTTLFPRDKDGSRSIYLPQHLRSYHLICLRKNMNWTIQQATNVFQILNWQYDKWITRDSKM